MSIAVSRNEQAYSRLIDALALADAQAYLREQAALRLASEPECTKPVPLPATGKAA